MIAKDPDEGVSGTVSYAIVGSVIPKSLSLFKIHSSAGRIKTIGALDYNDMKEHTLIIKASDQGVPKRESLFSVVISVVDVNDHKPAFLRSEFEAEVHVDATPGTSVLKVFASDEDDGTNAVLKFSIKAGDTHGAFYIDQNSGIIQVAAKLSHSVNKYSLQVQVSDSGTPAKTAETEVKVRLHAFIYSQVLKTYRYRDCFPLCTPPPIINPYSPLPPKNGSNECTPSPSPQQCSKSTSPSPQKNYSQCHAHFIIVVIILHGLLVSAGMR